MPCSVLALVAKHLYAQAQGLQQRRGVLSSSTTNADFLSDEGSYSPKTSAMEYKPAGRVTRYLAAAKAPRA